MDNQKLELILDRLIDLGEKGQLNWKKTAIQGVFLLALKDSSISVTKLVDGLVRLEFRDERGTIVEELDVYATEYEKYKKVNKLFDLARRKATNADETIDSILKQLNPDSIAA
jgi:hypothetical protein